MYLNILRARVLLAFFLPVVFCLPASAGQARPASPPVTAPGVPPVPVWTTEPAQEVIRLGEGHWFFDFGRARFGQPVLHWRQPPAITLRLHLGERLSSPGQIDRQPPGTVRYQAHELPLDPSDTEHSPALTWQPPGWLKAGFVTTPGGRGEVMPFRYVEIEGLPPDFDPSRLKRHSLALPFDAGAAHFRSSSPELDAVWTLSRHTTEATTFAGIYVDGDRERLPYEGDAHIQQLSHYALDRNYATARHTLNILLGQPTWPLEWQMNTVMMAWEDLLYTGDTAFVQQHRARLAAATLSALAREDGLLDVRREAQTPEFLASIGRQAPLRTLIDWPPGERDGHVRGRVDAVVNAYHHHSLVLMSRITQALGLQSEARQWQIRAQQVFESFQRTFWDPALQRYRDSEGTDHASLHSNLFALRFGLVPPEHRQAVLAHIRTRGMAGSVYAAQHLLDALYELGEAQWALDLMRSDGERSWLGMLHQGSTMTLEAWNLAVKPNLDWNHAWGTAPVNVIARGLVGVRPLTPGASRLLVRPQPGDLDFFDARVPTPHGPVDVIWTRKVDGHELSVTVPGNTVAELWLPGEGLARELPPGMHRFAVPAQGPR